MTLLESEITAPIPAYFLGEDLVEHIRFGATTAVGTSDPEMILPGSCDADEWSAYPDGIRTETLVGETYTAQVLWLKDGSGSIEEYLRIVSAENNHCKYMGFRPDGTLLLSDEHTSLQELGATSISPCGAVLLLNGRANEALLAGESAYAPYTAIGQRADGTMVRITTNGWNKDAMGATYRDLINIFYEYDVVNACIIFSGEE
jgi:hypothetical protein